LFIVKPSFWRRSPPAGTVIEDQDQQTAQVVDGGEQTDVKCEPVPAELTSKNVIT